MGVDTVGPLFCLQWQLNSKGEGLQKLGDLWFI